jgi:tetraacyldisaccharide 4'-kinase
MFAAVTAAHRCLRHKPRHPHDSFLPLVVIGSLRAGGAGKTAVVIELANRFNTQGWRVGILAYWLRKSGKQDGAGLKYLAKDLAEVTPEADWRHCSDEAVLMARASNARIFTTRNREGAWKALSRIGELDFLISDDGLMDPRLRDAFRVVLKMPGETPGLFDLLPAGPYRMTTGILSEVDCVLEGPSPKGINDEPWFRRELVFPEGFERNRPCWAVCGLGHPEAFRRDLLDMGVNLIGMSSGPDHGLPDLKDAENEAKRGNAAGFVCTAKDWIKLDDQIEALSPVTVVRERIEMSPGFISSVEAYLAWRSSS